MGLQGITVDTHTLMWYVDELLKGKLSAKAIAMIRQAEIGNFIYIPTIALIEILDLVERRRVSISFDKLMSFIEENECYRIVPFDYELLKIAIPLKSLEIHDRLILATAMLTNSTLVSKDRMLKNKYVNVVW